MILSQLSQLSGQHPLQSVSTQSGQQQQLQSLSTELGQQLQLASPESVQQPL